MHHDRDRGARPRELFRRQRDARRSCERAAAMTQTRRFTVCEAGRLDRAIVAEMPELSRAQVRRLIEEGRVTVDQRVVERPAMPVVPGTALEVVVPVVAD